MKKLLTILLLSSAVMAANSFAETVYVDGKPVSQTVINNAINQFKKSSPMASAQINNPAFKKEILQSIGMQQAILLEGNKQHLDNTAAYKQALENVKPMLYAQVLQERASQGQVSDADALAKYNQMKQQMTNQKQYDVSHILVKDLATANTVEAQLKSGADFASLAKKYSIDPGSKAKGGELGWSNGTNYVPQFTDAIMHLQKGQYTTTPVKTQFGYHIIKLNNVKTGGTSSLPPFAKVKEQIKQQIQMEKTRSFFEGLKSKYHVEVK